MTVTFNPDATFLGVPLVQVRDFLKRWHRFKLKHVADIKTLDLDFRTVAVLADETERQGLIGMVEEPDLPGHFTHGLTRSGLGLAGATPMRPYPRAKAQALIQELLNRCETVNRRDDLPFTVDQVWLFGSYVRNEPELNDIDFVIVSSRTPLAVGHDDQLWDMAMEMGGASWLRRSMSNRPIWYIYNRTLFGERRHPRLAENDLSTLMKLGCECQLVFDAKRGGPIDEPVLPRHPDSPGRDPEILEKLTLPDLREDLTPVPILPFHAEISSGTALDADGRVQELYENEYETLGQISDCKDRVRAIVDSVYIRPKPNLPVLSKWLTSIGPLDGRDRAVYAIGGEQPGDPATGVLFGRRMEQLGPDEWRYEVDILDVKRIKASAASEWEDVAIGNAILCLAGCDVERIVRHAKAAGHNVALRLSVVSSSAAKFGGDVAIHIMDGMDLQGASRGDPWLSEYANSAITWMDKDWWPAEDKENRPSMAASL